MKDKGEILASRLKNFGNCYFFMHNTKENSTVEKIINEGFIFEDQLLHSSDRVNVAEPIEIAYFMLLRKDYGPYTIVIAIPKETFEYYSAVSLRKEVGLEEVITITKPYYGDNYELVYKLSPKHILGHFNTITGEFFENSKWDPEFNNCKSKSTRNISGRNFRK
jgi:hypothetical protein